MDEYDEEIKSAIKIERDDEDLYEQSSEAVNDEEKGLSRSRSE